MNTRDQSICVWLISLCSALFQVGFRTPVGPVISPATTGVPVAHCSNAAAMQISPNSLNIVGIGSIPFFFFAISTVIVAQLLREAIAGGAFVHLGLSAQAGTLFALADLGWLKSASRPKQDLRPFTLSRLRFYPRDAAHRPQLGHLR